MTTHSASALADIATERGRQIEIEGWSTVHDDEHFSGCMGVAAAAYALTAAAALAPDDSPWREEHRGNAVRIWPWGEEWFKPKDPRRDLVRAGALILAEIERIDRAAAAEADSKVPGAAAGVTG